MDIDYLSLTMRRGGDAARGERRSETERERITVRDVKRERECARERREQRGREDVLMLLEFTDISEMQVLEGKHAAAFTDDRGSSRKEAGRVQPEQCTESAKHCVLKIMWQ